MIALPEPYVAGGDTFRYVFEDEDVVDGLEYTYSIVAYDMGVEPPTNVTYEPIGNCQFIEVLDTNYSNPDQWASPEGYANIENSKGTTVLDRNYVQLYPGVQPQDNLDNVSVVPNPYIISSRFNESTNGNRIRFTNLPQQCNINIYTISGEFVKTINHDDSFKGSSFWDLENSSGRTVAPGLYIYTLETSNGLTKVGKFAVVR